MTNTQLKLYLRRVVSQLDTIYEQIENDLPENIERFQYKKKRLKQEIQKEVDEKRYINPCNFKVNEMIMDESNYEEHIEFGDIIALEPLTEFIDELNHDISLLDEEEK